ncbi:alpha/beta hydrolase [Nocardia cyriacigeorgica]|uniref:alpha/beta hydrolase n=2 Tax=Nocardia cyriacigeorgica TaxID=135487 RepID=UPI0018959BFA|nr:alpha/beta fold hydrolase [Nocardia cyriacigeorgica]MBF6435215.1 alpha/beta fold hydrolase [Nocardia cyriacigeorgica]MBF6454719.1 alpha/beta fold hydrolase [Nocardia cyriacigeorgica]MBF6552613.1 alpha/beta fold hydrolase [Nocardia cyriacigeorgica]
MGGFRRSAVVAMIAAVVAGSVTGCGETNSVAGEQGLPWCPTVAGHAVDCGVVERPLVAEQPGLGTVDVGYALVRRAKADEPAAGTVLPNPGGPGVPMIAHAAEAAALAQGLLDDHDLLLIDARGTGVSSPLDCGLDDDAFAFGTRAQQQAAVQTCGTTLGARAAGYTSAATADDFDAVRAHLGIDTVVLYGISYGTYLMPVYAQRHPDRVRSMVLSGAYPADFDRFQRPNAEAVSLALHRICERSRVCDGSTAVADLTAVAARLRETPIQVHDPQPMRLDEGKLANLVFEAATTNAGARPAEIGALGLLPSALHAAARGDDGELREFVRVALSGAGYENVDSYLAVACNDYPTLWSMDAPPARREQQYRDALATVGPTLGGFSTSGWLSGQRDGGDVCLRWPGLADHQRPDRIRDLRPPVPVLVISGDLDAITPDANGKLAAAAFPDATFVSVPNTGHVPEVEPSGCVAGVITEFVRTGAVGSTDCIGAVPPIAVRPVTD